ncbi:epidermal growth factor receptor kinase substrate 8 [Paragonimus westermani]|uniref:Epidermal growth factor receptor kinase substrate 8 n=1 Tax=Paragonimus westermani TaxID=34504 RepID=A0A5J4NQ70_9TREM|nr:epidermal growth factor receptor kinase substrate 8 [Paragonimus westermani]
MLNRCLDDIQHFGKRLNKCVIMDSDGAIVLKSDGVQVPTRYAAIDCVRKIKYSLNLNQEVEADAPEAAQKVFIRLIKFVRWLDGIAGSRIVPNFDENLVRDVIEPLLTDRTLEAVRERLTPPLEEFWAGLGAPWNTSSSQWPNPITTYIPLFHTTPKNSVTDLVRKRIFRTSSSTDLTSPNKNTKAMVKCSRPRIKSKEHEHFFMKIQERGGCLCFATVRHMKSREPELDADQGEVFEILDSTKDDCWKVENYSGDRGEVPKLKLRPFTLKPHMYQKERIPKKSTRRGDTSFFPSPGGALLEKHSNSRSQPMGSYMNVAYTPVEISYPIKTATIPSDGSTVMVYLPIQQMGGIQGQGSPVLLLPYRSKSHDEQYQLPGRSDHVRDEHRTSGSFPYQQSPMSSEFVWPYKISTGRMDDFEATSRFGHIPLPSSRLLKYSHPHSPSPYDPTIVLDTKYKPKAARI